MAEPGDLPLHCGSFHYADGKTDKAGSFSCVISFAPVYDPVQCLNGHLNCRRCLSECEGMKCSSCHGDADGNNGFGIAPKGLVGLLDSLGVVCQDCNKKVQRCCYVYHRNEECPVLCPLGCGSSTSRLGQASHVALCNTTDCICPAMEVGCGWRGMRSDLVSHQNSCMIF